MEGWDKEFNVQRNYFPFWILIFIQIFDSQKMEIGFRGLEKM